MARITKNRSPLIFEYSAFTQRVFFFRLCSDREISVCICLEEMKNLVWCGTSGIPVDKIQPARHADVPLHLMPLDLGLQVSFFRLLFET